MKWSDSERGCGWEHHDRKERLAPEAERQRKWVKNKTRLMINLRPPWWGQSWTKNSIPTAQCLNYFFFLPLVLTCLPQLRSNARGHLKISTAKATQHVSPHGEGEGSAKSLSWSLYGFSTVCLRPWAPTACHVAAALQPGDARRVLAGFIETFLCFAYSSWKPPELFFFWYTKLFIE